QTCALPIFEREHGARLGRGALDFADVGDAVFGEAAKSRAGHVGTARIADQHLDAGRQASVEEGGDLLRQVAFVKEVADADQIYRKRRTACQIVADHRDRDTIRCGVEADRSDGVAVDVGRGYRGGAG